jgi:hypothetical protein
MICQPRRSSSAATRSSCGLVHIGSPDTGLVEYGASMAAVYDSIKPSTMILIALALSRDVRALHTSFSFDAGLVQSA